MAGCCYALNSPYDSRISGDGWTMKSYFRLLLTIGFGWSISGCVTQSGHLSEYAQIRAASQVLAVQDLGYQESQARGDSAVVIASIGVPYPASAYAQRVGGKVTLKFTIGTDGAANDIQILGEPEVVEFDRYALVTLKKWRFKPMIRDGKALPAKDMTFTIVFDPVRIEPLR